MKRLLLMFGFCICLTLMVGTVTANPRQQSDLNIITYDNFLSLRIVDDVTYEDDDFADLFLSADNHIAVLPDQNRVEILQIDRLSVGLDEVLIVEAEECDGDCFLTHIALMDKHVAVSTSNGIFMIFDIDTGERILMHREHEGYSINDIAVDVGSNQFISIDDNGMVSYAVQINTHLYEVQNVKVNEYALQAIAIDPNSNQIAVVGGSSAGSEHDYTIYVWDSADVSAAVEPLPILELEGSQAPVHTMTFSTDGLLVSGEYATGDEQYVIRFWDTESGQQIADLSNGMWTDNRITAIIFSLDGSLMGVHIDDGFLYRWDMRTLRLEGHISGRTGVSASIMEQPVIMSADGHYLIWTVFRAIRVWSLPMQS